MTDEDANITDAFKLADDKYRSGDYAGALEYFLKHVESNPQDALALNIIGHLYKRTKGSENLDEQIQYFEKAVEIKPDFRSAVRNLAFAYSIAEKYDEAIKTYHRLFELEPLADDYYAYACLKIKLGHFEEGWKHFESRFAKSYGRTDYPQIDKPRWEGQKILDKTLLVQYEQGFGDSIQFFRYLEQMKPLVGKIIFRVQDELVDLLKINSDGMEIVGKSTPINGLSFDYHIPLMSLLTVLQSRKDNIPSSCGYIKADENKVEIYKKEFFDNSRLKIGICWYGMQTGNRSRNVSLKYFYPLANLNSLGRGIQLYSFQKGEGAKKLKELPPNIEIIDLGKSFNDFSDTAAAMKNIDLFITADNSVFNLAGALGTKTFVLLNRDSEWRWFLDEEKTPWYDSVKIFKKQNDNQDWSLLMQRVVDEVKKINAI